MGTPLRVERWSGFGVNRVGVPGQHSTGGPLSFSLARSGDVGVVTAVSARAVEIADLLVRDAHPHLLVFDVGHHEYEGDAQVPLARIAAEAGVAARAFDVTWAAPRGVVGELLVVASGDLRALLADLALYDVTVVDTADPESYEEVVLAAKTEASEPSLLTLPGSRLLYGGHDDHYVYVETRSPALPAVLLARLLALLAGSATLGERDAVLVHEPPAALAEGLLGESADWVAWPVALSGSSLELGLRDVRWSPGEAFPDTPAWTVTYDVAGKGWGDPRPA